MSRRCRHDKNITACHNDTCSGCPVLRQAIRKAANYPEFIQTLRAVINAEEAEPVTEEVIRAAIDILVSAEFARGTEKYGPFHSKHEGHGVLKEEIEELVESLDGVSDSMPVIWQATRKKVPDPEERPAVEKMLTHAINMVFESIQVAAMAKKYLALLDKEDADYGRTTDT